MMSCAEQRNSLLTLFTNASMASEALDFALATAGPVDVGNLRLAWIKMLMIKSFAF